jgi:hypothetical protein
MEKRNWHWTLNRRARRYGWNIEKFPKSNMLTDFQGEFIRLLDSLKSTESILDFQKLLVGYVEILKKGNAPHSQLGQDSFVVGFTNGAQGLNYLEIGAYDPNLLSNTAVLRDSFAWSGLSVDPNPESGIKFIQAGFGDRFREIGVAGTARSAFLRIEGALTQTLASSENVKNTKRIDLVPIKDLAVELKYIDYLSLDIEGGELDVLEHFPFDQVQPRLITVEHNNRKNDKSAIDRLLCNSGYRSVLPELTDYESWYLFTGQQISP